MAKVQVECFVATLPMQINYATSYDAAVAMRFLIERLMVVLERMEEMFIFQRGYASIH